MFNAYEDNNTSLRNTVNLRVPAGSPVKQLAPVPEFTKESSPQRDIYKQRLVQAQLELEQL